MLSKCPHCKSTLWELQTEEPRGSAFKINFIRCFSCKAPVGTMEYYNLHSTLEKIEKEVKYLKSSISNTTNMIQVIDENVRRLFNK